jgi:hypothetical protein
LRPEGDSMIKAKSIHIPEDYIIIEVDLKYLFNQWKKRGIVQVGNAYYVIDKKMIFVAKEG